jgi:uncharacterized protein YcnI
MSTKRLTCLGLLGAAALALLSAAPAAAHVTVQPGEATKGGYAKLAFRVPNESETAGTIKLEVSFPQDTPLSSVRTRPMAGWTAEVRKEKLATPVRSGEREITEAVRSVTWTAQPGVRIGPDEFTEFEVSVGPLPGADRLLLPATQTYDDGEVVVWDVPPATHGGEEAEHPAPVLKLMNPEPDVSPEDAAADTASGRDASPPSGQGGQDDTARRLGAGGIAVGALGVGLAIGAVLSARRRGAGPA